MKKPALLLCVFLALQVLPVQAAMIVNDHFDGGALSSSWEVRYEANAYGWHYDVADSHLSADRIYISSDGYWGHVYLSQQFDPIDDFEAKVAFDWIDYTPEPPKQFGIRLMDSDHNRISGIYSSVSTIAAGFGDSASLHGGLPLTGSAIATIIRKNGVVDYYWNDILLTSKQLLDQATTLELQFSFYQWPGYDFGKVNIDYVSLESDPVDPSATPEPGTLVLVGLALVLGALWQLWSRKRAV